LKNILHIISSKQWRGGEQQVHYLLNAHSANYRKFLFCPEGSELQKRNFDENIFTYRKKFGADIFAAWKLAKIIKHNKIDLLHLHDSHAINTFILANVLGNKVPAVIHRHVNFPIKSTWKYSVQKIKKIICVSEEVQRTIQLKIAGIDTVVVHPGIDVRQYEENPEIAVDLIRNQLNIPKHKTIIGTISALEEEKNIEEFIAIAHKLLMVHPDLHFLVVGDGSRKGYFIRLIQANNLGASIQFTGFRNDIPFILHLFSILLFTSKSEGFPIVILEAMAACVPVVSTDSGGIKNMIQHNFNGLLYSLGDIDQAVQLTDTLLNSRESKTQLTGNAFDYVQQFDIPLMNKNMEAIYSSLNYSS